MVYEMPEYISELRTYGRKTISVPLKDSELDSETVKNILMAALPIHFENVRDINYLRNYYKGKQDILNKEKTVRPEINNKVVENHAWHIVEFKKGYVFGDPIQYVTRDDEFPEELNKLNDYMVVNEKSAKDLSIAEDWYIFGVGYQIVLPNNEETLPFIVEDLDAANTFMVRSSYVGNDVLLGCYLMVKLDGTYEVMCYSKNAIYYFAFEKEVNVSTAFESVTFMKEEPNPLGKVPIFEYALNKSKLGLVELVKSITDALNKLTSFDLDDIEQFIQSLLVFTNQKVDANQIREMAEMGAVSLFTIDPAKPASLDMVSEKMGVGATDSPYNRLMANMLMIAGIPSISEKVSGGDTGQARRLGDGWVMADERAKQDEISFKSTEKKMLELVLSICKLKKNSGIKNLDISQIDIKFTRNKSDNMLTKAQTLMMMKEAQVDPEVAFTVVSMFSDPSQVVQNSKEYFGDNFWKQPEPSENKEEDEKAKIDNAEDK